MAVEVANEAAVVRSTVIRPRPWAAIDLGAGLERGFVERMDRLLGGGDEADMRAVSDRRRPPIDRDLHPELRKVLPQAQAPGCSMIRRAPTVARTAS